MFENLLRNLLLTEDNYETTEVSSQKLIKTMNVNKESAALKTEQKKNALSEQFSNDIKALEEHYGELVEGKTLELGLQEMLSICPRDRKRSDAYNSLSKFLKEEKNVELIVSGKKKSKK